MLKVFLRSSNIGITDINIWNLEYIKKTFENYSCHSPIFSNLVEGIYYLGNIIKYQNKIQSFAGNALYGGMKKTSDSLRTYTDYRYTLGIYSYEFPLKLYDYFLGTEILLGESRDIEHVMINSNLKIFSKLATNKEDLFNYTVDFLQDGCGRFIWASRDSNQNASDNSRGLQTMYMFVNFMSSYYGQANLIHSIISSFEEQNGHEWLANYLLYGDTFLEIEEIIPFNISEQNYYKALFGIKIILEGDELNKNSTSINSSITNTIKIKNPLKSLNFQMSSSLYKAFIHSILDILLDIRQIKNIVEKLSHLWNAEANYENNFFHSIVIETLDYISHANIYYRQILNQLSILGSSFRQRWNEYINLEELHAWKRFKKMKNLLDFFFFTKRDNYGRIH